MRIKTLIIVMMLLLIGCNMEEDKKIVDPNIDILLSDLQSDGGVFYIEVEYSDGSRGWTEYTGKAYEATKDNKVVEKYNFKRGYKHGRYREYYKNGNIKSKGSYKRGYISGRWIEYYNNGKVKEKGRYKEGYRDGRWKKYYESGKITTKERYKNGKLVGRYKKYKEDGKILEEGVGIYSFEKREGKRYFKGKLYTGIGFGVGYKGEKILYKYSYKDGVLDGRYLRYYESGGIREEGVYKKDLLDGRVREYNRCGRILRETTYKNGEVEGKIKEYDNGKVVEEGEVTSNLEEKEKMVYLDGKLYTGTAYEINDGRIFYNKGYENGVLIYEEPGVRDF